ncbi:MAG: alginate export family protein [Pseudomonadales bacterium]|nr:alginate export family protein [Pseudomonadales bacterium]
MTVAPGRLIQTLVTLTVIALATPSRAQTDDDVFNADSRSRAKDLSAQSDQHRPDDQFEIRLFGRSLIIGGEVGVENELRDNYSLDDNDDRDRWIIKSKAELELLYTLSDTAVAFAELRADYEQQYEDRGNTGRHDKSVSRGQSWLYLASLFESPLSLQLGRQQFRDKREWWWDDTLDALRLHWDTENLHMEAAYARELLPVCTPCSGINPAYEDVHRWLGMGEWVWTKKNSLAVFAARQDDRSSRHVLGEMLSDANEDPIDLSGTWLGLRARGRLKSDLVGRLYYWLDTAWMRGREVRYDYDGVSLNLSEVDQVRTTRVGGWALDTGLTIDFEDWPMQPRLTLGFAHADGAGDDAEGGGTFVQTGIHDNNGKFRGVDRFKYYGEVLRPELANLRIYTLGLGLPILDNSSVELIAHRYAQVEPSTLLRGSRMRRPVTGRSTDIGTAVDLVIGIEEWRQFEVELVVGGFRSGDAFGRFAGNTAFNVTLSLDFNF